MRNTAIYVLILLAGTAAGTQPPIAEHVSRVIERERQIDSADASDIFLLPFAEEIDSVARIHKLPPALLAAFIQEESQWDQWALRTEPHYLKKKKVIAEARAWSRRHKGLPTYQTELWARSTSFGLMQVMGQVAREQGFDRRYLTELITPFNSIDEGAKHLLRKLRKYKNDTLSAISAYNQGDNRKASGMFVNARYVYRVTVAWREYEKIFQRHKLYEKLEGLLDLGIGIGGSGIPHLGGQIVRRTGSYHRVAFGEDHTSVRQRSIEHRAAIRAGDGPRKSEPYQINFGAIDERFVLAGLAAGLACLLGLDRLLRRRLNAERSRYYQRVPRRLDKKVRRFLRQKLAETRHSCQVHRFRS